jgi:hypothetical protein
MPACVQFLGFHLLPIKPALVLSGLSGYRKTGKTGVRLQFPSLICRGHRAAPTVKAPALFDP